MVAGSSRLFLTWRTCRRADRRARSRSRRRRPRARVRRRASTRAAVFAPAVRVDDGAPVDRSPRASTTGGRRDPRAIGDTVHVAWTDFRDYNWGHRATRSDDGGRTLRRAGASTVSRPRAHQRRTGASRRDAAATSGLAWTWDRARARRESVHRAQQRRRTHVAGRPSARPVAARLRSPTATVRACSTRSRSRSLASGFAAWQDDQRANQDYPLPRSTTGAAAWPRGARRRHRRRTEQPVPSALPSRATVGQCAACWSGDDRDGACRFTPPRALPSVTRGDAAAALTTRRDRRAPWAVEQLRPAPPRPGHGRRS